MLVITCGVREQALHKHFETGWGTAGTALTQIFPTTPV